MSDPEARMSLGDRLTELGLRAHFTLYGRAMPVEQKQYPWGKGWVDQHGITEGSYLWLAVLYKGPFPGPIVPYRSTSHDPEVVAWSPSAPERPWPNEVYRGQFVMGPGRIAWEPKHADPKRRAWLASKRERTPTTAQWVDCLLSDIDGCDEPFADWCANLGYAVTDSKAMEIYIACQNLKRKLQQVLGSDALNSLLYATERL